MCPNGYIVTTCSLLLSLATAAWSVDSSAAETWVSEPTARLQHPYIYFRAAAARRGAQLCVGGARLRHTAARAPCGGECLGGWAAVKPASFNMNEAMLILSRFPCFTAAAAAAMLPPAAAAATLLLPTPTNHYRRRPKTILSKACLAYSLLLHTLALASDYTIPTSMKPVWRLLNMNWFSCSIRQSNCRLHKPRTWHFFHLYDSTMERC